MALIAAAALLLLPAALVAGTGTALGCLTHTDLRCLRRGASPRRQSVLDLHQEGDALHVALLMAGAAVALCAVLLAVAMFCLAAFSSVNVIYLMLGSIGISIAAVAVAHAWARKKFLMAVSVGTPVYTRKGVALDPDLNADRSSSEGVKNSKDITPNGGFDVEEALDPASNADRSSSEGVENSEDVASGERSDIEEGDAIDPDADGVNEDEGGRKDA